MFDLQPCVGDLSFSEPISRWDEALPLGNGFCGALIWGPSDGLRFSLDRGDLWDASPCAAIHDPGYTYKNMVRLAREGKEDEIRRIFDAPYNHPTPSKLPAGKLILDFGADLPQSGSLSITDAQAHVQLGDTLLEAFVHAKKHLGMIRVCAPAASFSLRVENPEYGLYTGEEEEAVCNSVDTADLHQLRYPAAELGDLWFTQKISGGMEYGVFAQLRETAGQTEIAWCVASSADGETWKSDARQMLSDALDAGYAAELDLHRRWWNSFWTESGIDLPEELFNHNWYLAQYLFASCSRKGSFPMPLQGVWTADDGKLPPWKGDYHHDLNTELSYSHYPKAGHFDEGESFLDYLWNMRDCGRKFAREFYDADGICLPGTMTQNGDSLGGWGMYSLSPANQLWLCQSFERHWRFTGDRTFLEEKAYPYLKETAAFLLSLLEERDGQYFLPISTSPEIHDDTLASFLTPNSNYDLSLMRWLFTALAEMSHVLEDGREGEWQAHLDKLPALSVSEEGVLQLSPTELLQESHRHFSHAMAVYPLRLMPYEGDNVRIIDATVRQLEALGTDFWVGYSFAWMANLYAVQGNGDGAAQRLRHFWNGFCSPNGFHLNGDYKNLGLSTFHYRPFTLEANFYAADALQEMLLNTEHGALRLFPAIPAEWNSASFRRLRGEMGLSVSARLENGRITDLQLKSETDQTVRIEDRWGLSALLEREAENGWISLPMSAGEVIRFTTLYSL